ncbi:MAG TPA: kelch repeat-containing protein [Flavitalea sp.]|nr:kelch repeat-containing protein [Flavitalea sp.]
MNSGSLAKYILSNKLNNLVYRLRITGMIIIPALLLLTLLVSSLQLSAQSYGLQFASRDADPEKRTSLNLTPDKQLCVSGKVELSFELTFVPNIESYFGYVFRVINDKKQNLDMLYDMGRSKFKIVFGDAYAGIDFHIGHEALLNQWVKFRVEIDLKKGVSLFCNDTVIKSNPLPFKGNCFNICFGASNYVDFKSTDVSPMKIRNLGVTVNGTEKYFWPLNESNGETIMDSVSGKKATVTNAHWLKPKHASWELLNTMVTKSTPSVAFNPSEETLYITGTDSLYTFSAKTSTLAAIPLSSKHDNLLPGNQSIYNPYNNGLYNFYTDQGSVAQYNFLQHNWSRNFLPADLTSYWHVNKFFSGSDSSLYIVAGYGHVRYKNGVQRYDIASGKWDSVKTRGDYFTPRYLAALGTTPGGDSAYILGGYGSKDGDQLLNPRYYYDLLLYNVSSRSFKRLFSLKEPKEPFVFANSLVIDADRKHYYGLIFSKDQLNTQLQLIKGSLQLPDYELLGSPFPYTFFDTNSFADIFFCPVTKLFLAVTFYTNKNNNTEIRIYSIYSPPKPQETIVTNTLSGKENIYAYIIGSIVLLTIAILGIRAVRKRNVARSSPSAGDLKQTDQTTSDAESLQSANLSTAIGQGPVLTNDRDNIITEPAVTQDARVYLFGNFEVIGSNGENITRLFTPLLKELFLLLLIHSIRYKKGVSPEKLIETLWNNKDTKDAINNRAVNIAKLKSILERIEEFVLHKESGYWNLKFNPEKLYIDFDRYNNIFSESTISNRSVNELISLTQRGSFLPQADYQWADNIKSEISNVIVDTLLKYCKLLALPENAEKIISICNSIFSIDELNENALKLKCKSLIALGRHTLAKQAFEKFIVKYKEIYGEDYKSNYHSLINS